MVPLFIFLKPVAGDAALSNDCIHTHHVDGWERGTYVSLK